MSTGTEKKETKVTAADLAPSAPKAQKVRTQPKKSARPKAGIQGANEEQNHNLALARRKKAREDAIQSREHEVRYTNKGGKLLMYTVKYNGAHSTYLGRTKTLDPNVLQAKVKEWKEKGLWLDEFDLKEKLGLLVEAARMKYEQEEAELNAI